MRSRSMVTKQLTEGVKSSFLLLTCEFRGDLDPVAKTDEEIRLEKEYIEDMLLGMGTTYVMQRVYEPDSFREPVAGLWVCGDGNLWVFLGTEEVPTIDVWSVSEDELLYRAVLPMEISQDEFLRFHFSPHCRDFAAVHEDAGMAQRVMLIDREGVNQ